ncbi:MAG: MBL fold metallo-hydrolase [Gemmatimonadaceae bacterium]
MRSRLLAAAAAIGIAIAPLSASPIGAQTALIVLGTGTPNADPDRSGPAVAIVVNGHAYLVDAGAGIVRRAALAARTTPALAVAKLDIVFLTHLHSDHTLGLPDLMLSPWVLERTKPLRVFGPKGTTAMTDALTKAYSFDIDIRLRGGEPSNKTGYKTEARDVKPGIVYKDSNVTVTAFPVLHGTIPQAFGYRFQTADRVIVVSGDTRPSEEIVRQCSGCDVLLHEVYSADGFKKRTPDWQAYHSSFHTSTTELADIASRAKPKLLVMYHQLYFGGTTDADLLAEIARTYKGPVKSAQDLGKY